MIADNMKIEFKPFEGFTPLPEDKYTVELLDINTKEAKGQFAKPGDMNLSFQFVLLEGEAEDGTSLRGRSVWANFAPTTLFDNPKAKNWPGKCETWRIIEALSGVEMKEEATKAGLTGEVLNALIGEQCVVFTANTVSKTDSTKVFSNIINYKVATKKLKPLTDEEKEKARVKGSEVPGEKVEDVLAEAEAHLG